MALYTAIHGQATPATIGKYYMALTSIHLRHENHLENERVSTSNEFYG
jgi:hypothetical protein